MGRYAVLKNSVVVNLIEADDTFRLPGFGLVPATDGAAMGAVYASGVFTSAQEETVPEPVPHSISRKQFYMGLERDGKITKAEALAAMKLGVVPARVQTIIDGILDEAAAYEIEMNIIGANDFYRDNIFVDVFALFEAMTDDEVDEFWRMCAAC